MERPGKHHIQHRMGRRGKLILKENQLDSLETIGEGSSSPVAKKRIEKEAHCQAVEEKEKQNEELEKRKEIRRSYASCSRAL
jgi:hypothetical protein